jgi:transposase InsO family protein
VNSQNNHKETLRTKGGEGRNFNQSRWTNKSRIQCYYCKKFGHYESECRKKQEDLNRGRENVTNTEEGTSESMFFSCQVTEEASNNHDLWLLDSGCNNHMTGNKDFFSSLDSSVTSQIKLGDDYQKKVLGKGVVFVLTKQDEKKDIHDVYYVPGLRHNLMSVGQMNEHGYKVIFEGSKCTILDKPPSKKIIATIQMTKNRMFPLILRNLNLSQSYAQNVSSSDETWLWHLRYGHLPFSSLSILQKKSMVKGFPIINEQKNSCESCILAKHQRDSFLDASYREKEHLELVHTDLCGPMQTQSIGGRFYFLTFIDDFSRKSWVYFLKHKSETFEKFREFKSMTEKQSGKYIKVLRSDRGGEYDSKEFTTYCRQHGIKRQFTTRYTPQQNGVAERKNQTIMNMARSMLKAKNLSNEYWGEAVACSVYILNLSPTNKCEKSSPSRSLEWYEI